MDHEGLVLSTIPLGAAAHQPSDEVASVIDGRPFLLVDGPMLSAGAAREALWSGETLHELPAAGWRASPVVAAATCRISLRNAGRDGTNAGFSLWGGPYHVVKQAHDRADVLAEQGRFALARGKVSC